MGVIVLYLLITRSHRLVDNEVVTRCDISTMETDETPILAMDHMDRRAQMILGAEWLTAALQNFHQSCSRITFTFHPATRADRRGFLRIHGETDAGSAEATLPADGKPVFKFDCERKTEYSYSFAHVSLALKGLQTASKASVRIDVNGLLSIQCLIPIGQSLMDDATRGGRVKIEASHLPIVDYLCCPYDD